MDGRCYALHAIRVMLIAVAATFFATQAHAEKRVALIIGNGAYRNVPVLPNPPNDANDVGNSLARLGFAVTRVKNARYDEMRRALLTFGRNARTADIAIVFYAGHGIEVGGENWLIPIDAELRSDIDVEQEAIGLKSIMLTVQSASNLGLVILDACRNNPFAAKMRRSIRTRAVARGLVGVEPTGNVLVAYAARDGTTALDGAGRNSPFTAALLRYVETPGLEINFLFRNVRDDVMKATKREQQPFVYGSLSKEKIFLKAPLPTPVIAAPPAGPKPDELTWALIKDTNDPGALRRFIEQFPRSKLRAQAQRREAELILAAKYAKDAAEKRMAALTAAANAAKAAAEQAPKIDPAELARSVQLELKRVGCFDDAVDGKYGDRTRNALRNFARYAAVKIDSTDLSEDVLKAIRGADRRICPLVCAAGERVEGDRCVRLVCPSGQIAKNGTCISKGGTAIRARAKAPPAPGGSKCFTFDGRRFCE